MADGRSAARGSAMAVYRALAAVVGRRVDTPLMRALRWVQAPFDESLLRVGYDPATPGLNRRLPRRLSTAGAQAEVCWVPSTESGVAHAWFRPENLDHSVGPGTLTAVLRDTGAGTLYGLTAGHVLGGDPDARFGNRASLTCSGSGLPPLVGRVHNWSPDLARIVREADFDAGLMTLDEATLDAWVDEMDWPSGWKDVAGGDAVRVLTRQHQLPGRVIGHMTAPMRIGDPPVYYTLRDVLCCEIDGGSDPGDSGAPVWDDDRHLVGLLVGSSPPGTVGNAIVTPIGRILAWSGCQPVLAGEPLVSEGREAPKPSSPVAVALPRPASVPGPSPALPGSPPSASARPSAAPVPSAAELTEAVDVLARTMWGEARGEPDARVGMEAVAHVVANRVDKRSWWGRDVKGVCTYPWQFSCWNANDPNRRRLIEVTRSDALLALACEVAAKVLGLAPAARRIADPTAGATHYYATSIGPPAWVQGATFTARIGHHLFYRDVR